MRGFRAACLLVVPALLVVAAAEAQKPLPREFGTVSYSAGLINSSVSSIAQDETGFLWFGTQAGVQRYDGYTMNLYTAEPFNRDSLSNQLVQTIYMAPDNVLWIGTYGGLNRLDTFSGRIRSFPHAADDSRSLSNNVVTGITHDRDGYLWVATLDGLNRLDDEENGTFRRFRSSYQDEFTMPHDTVRAVFLDSRGDLWVGSLGGLSRVVTGADAGRDAGRADPVRFITWSDEGSPEESLPSPYVMTIAEDATGYLWIGTWDGGVSRFDPETGTFRHYKTPDTRLYTLMISSTGLVYAGTWGGGLHVIDPDTDEIFTYRHDPELSGSLAHDVVYSLFEDHTGMIWIGTNGNGINTFDASRGSFRYIHPELPREQRLDSGKIQALWRNHETGELYVGLQNTGMNVIDPADGTVTRYRHDPGDPRSISSDTVNAFLPELGGTLLVSTHGGINRFHPPAPGEDGGHFSRVPEMSIPDPIVYRMIRDGKGRIWVGTYSNGVFRFDPDGTRHRFSHDPANPRSLTNNLVYDIMEDRFGVIWIATNGGLNRYQPATDDFDRFVYDASKTTGISGLSVGNLYEDSRGTLWVGTRSGGLNRFDRQTETFRHFGIRDGLSSNAVVALREGEPGNLYIATPNGLNLLRVPDETVTTIDERDGLLVREFSTGVARDTDGSLLFGAFSEVVRVAPGPEQVRDVPPRTVITSVRVLNAVVDEPLEYQDTPELELTHEQDYIEFSFSALSFSLPERNTYQYRLTGFDSTWIDAGTRRTATYTNVPAGVYSFEVLGTDARGITSVAPATVKVTILPPWWRTRWFVSGLTAFVAALVVTAYFLRVRTFRRINRRLEETVAERTARLTEANEVKDRFFSIIAHDLRGPVSGMESISRQAAADASSFTPEMIGDIFSAIHGSAAALQSMLENLLEWARVQSGRFEYEPRSIPVATLFNEIIQANAAAAQNKKITLHADSDVSLRVWADLDMTRVVLQNLVSNAIKFTPPEGDVSLASHVVHGDDRVELVVRDTGVGIPEEKTSEIFRVDSRYRTIGTAGERGTGFGLSLCRDLMVRQNGELHLSSTVGTGTTVTILLPRGEPAAE